MPTFALRPSVLVSVALHAGAFVGAAAIGAGGAARDRDAIVLAFATAELGSLTDAPEVPVVPPVGDPRLEAPVVVEPDVPEPDVTEPPLPPDDAALPPTEAFDPDPATPPLPAPSPTARTRPARSASAAPPAVPAPALPPSVAARAGAARVSTVATARPTNRPPPYPDAALRAGWQGVVWMIVDVGADGRVASVSIERSSGYEVLDAAAVDAVSTWTYDPRVVDGVPAPDRLRLPVRFTSSTSIAPRLR